ncbi:hypothetical protein HOH87_06625 [bacterium]|jgi:hypothetical protein|nr:hypothetical protein [bacterium]
MSVDNINQSSDQDINKSRAQDEVEKALKKAVEQDGDGYGNLKLSDAIQSGERNAGSGSLSERIVSGVSKKGTPSGASSVDLESMATSSLSSKTDNSKLDALIAQKRILYSQVGSLDAEVNSLLNSVMGSDFEFSDAQESKSKDNVTEVTDSLSDGSYFQDRKSEVKDRKEVVSAAPKVILKDIENEEDKRRYDRSVDVQQDIKQDEQRNHYTDQTLIEMDEASKQREFLRAETVNVNKKITRVNNKKS